MKLKIFIFSSLFIALCLFLSLNTECYATNDIIFNVPGINISWNITQLMNNIGYSYDFNNNTQYILSYDKYNEIYTLYFTNSNIWYDNINEDAFVTNEYGYIFDIGQSNVYYSNSDEDFGLVYSDELNNSNYDFYFNNNVVVYTDNTFTTPINLIQYNNVSIGNYTNNSNNENNNVNNSVNNSVVNNSVVNNSVGDNDSENNNGILDFLLDFWNNFVHIIVPSQEDFEDLQESFNDNILSVFSLTSLSRNSSYSNNDKYPSVNYNDKMPIFNIMGYEFDTTYIKNFLDTPFTFGILRYQMGDTSSDTQVYTGGLTCRHLISLIFAIEICAMNIALYNKFFNKGE